MIHLYKKYHVAYWCIGIALIVCMVASMIGLMFCKTAWFVPFLVIFPTIILVFVSASVFTKLTVNKLNNEVVTLLMNCEANKYLSELQALFKDKAQSGIIVTIYNTMLASGYSAIDDYDSAYECIQKITARNYQSAKSMALIDYYISKGTIEETQNEIEKLRTLIAKMKNPKYTETCERSIKNAEYAIRIKQGNFEGAEEHYKKMMETIKPLYPISKVSYSYAIGRLLVLKGEPERAREYLQTAYDLGGDTKYKKHAEERLREIQGGKETEA